MSEPTIPPFVDTSVPELGDRRPWLVCHECGEIFDTEKDLVNAYNEALRAMGLGRKAVSDSSEIWNCPACDCTW